MKKPKKITNSMQEVAVDILERLNFIKSLDEIPAIFQYVAKKYGLYQDPFTHLPCTSKEYAKNIVEYNKQTMIEKFGYYD